MSLTDTYRTVENKIIFLFYETDTLQFFPGQSRRQFNAAVFIAFEGLIGRKTCSFDQTVPFILFPAGDFLPERGGKVLDLLRRAALFD